MLKIASSVRDVRCAQRYRSPHSHDLSAGAKSGPGALRQDSTLSVRSVGIGCTRNRQRVMPVDGATPLRAFQSRFPARLFRARPSGFFPDWAEVGHSSASATVRREAAKGCLETGAVPALRLGVFRGTNACLWANMPRLVFIFCAHIIRD